MAAASMIETPGIRYAGGGQPQLRAWPGLSTASFLEPSRLEFRQDMARYLSCLRHG
jgi:hypothetical protein